MLFRSAEPTAAPAASLGPIEGRAIELELAALSIVMDGAPVKEIAVTPGETVTFVLTNTANAPENFWIGTDAQLGSNQTVGLPGVPEFSSGTQQFTWEVPADVTGLKFGVTVPGHYLLQQGVFTVAEGAAPAEPR